MAGSVRGSSKLVKDWAAKTKPIPDELISEVGELLDEWKILHVLTNGIPAVDHVSVRFESGANADDFERCGNVLHRLHGLHADGVPIEIRWLINGIPAFDRIVGEVRMGTQAR